MTQEEEEERPSTETLVCPAFAEARCAEVGFPDEEIGFAEAWVVPVGFALRGFVAADFAKAG